MQAEQTDLKKYFSIREFHILDAAVQCLASVPFEQFNVSIVELLI